MALPDPCASLTIDELDRSERAGDRYKSVTADQLFSRTSNSLLAAEVRKNDPVRYVRLKRAYGISLGEIPGDLIPPSAEQA